MTVETWFSEKIATGEIARATVVYNHALRAKNNLLALLDAGAKGQPPADATVIACQWYAQELITGVLALSEEATLQAEDAKDDLISNLAAPKPAPRLAQPTVEKE